MDPDIDEEEDPHEVIQKMFAKKYNRRYNITYLYIHKLGWMTIMMMDMIVLLIWRLALMISNRKSL